MQRYVYSAVIQLRISAKLIQGFGGDLGQYHEHDNGSCASSLETLQVTNTPHVLGQAQEATSKVLQIAKSRMLNRFKCITRLRDTCAYIHNAWRIARRQKAAFNIFYCIVQAFMLKASMLISAQLKYLR